MATLDYQTPTPRRWSRRRAVRLGSLVFAVVAFFAVMTAFEMYKVRYLPGPMQMSPPFHTVTKSSAPSRETQPSP